MTTIRAVHAREILDSRGRPTVQADVHLSDGTLGRASVPSGASTGRHEAVELRDGGSRYGGMGVRRAVESIDGSIADRLRSETIEDPERLDRAMIEADGTDDKSVLGANAILAVSLALARACAAHHRQPLYRYLSAGAPVSLPLPMTNMVSGGMHARSAMDIQDVLVVPVGARTYSQALEWISDVFRSLGGLLDKANLLPSGVADEGGYGLSVTAEQALTLVTEAIASSGHEPGNDIAIAVDMASSRLVDTRGGYLVDGDRLTSAEMVERVVSWTARFPIISVEDVLDEDDWHGWVAATERLSHVQLVGDDLFTTNVRRIQRGLDLGVANSVLVKVNQIGTLTESRAAVALAREHGYSTVISARSGETEDDFLADLAVGLDGGQIKIGALTRSERLSKYNRLLQIEEELGESATLARPFAVAGAGAVSPQRSG